MREKLVDAKTEKRVNAYLNIWLRAPGLNLVAFLVYHVWVRSKVRVYTNAETLATGVLIFANGNYYLSRVVANAAATAGFRPDT